MPREACQKIVLECGECIALSSVLESLGLKNKVDSKCAPCGRLRGGNIERFHSWFGILKVTVRVSAHHKVPFPMSAGAASSYCRSTHLGDIPQASTY
jgi:hypothetical protein